MTTTNYLDEQVTLTELEAKVYNSLKDSDTMDDCYCDCHEEITDNTGIKPNQLRGVISSLVKKGVAYCDELVSGCGEWVILYESK